MALPMQTIVDDVTRELRLMSGSDVQIHLQDSIVANINRIYRTLNKRFLFKDYLAYNSFLLDGTTGLPTTAVPATLDKYSKLVAVFRQNDTVPLPFAAGIVNSAKGRRYTVYPSGESHIFKVLPAIADTVVVINKTYSDTDYTILSTDVPFDRDVLAIGAASMLSAKMGLNDKLTDTLEKQFANLVETLKLDQLEDAYPTNLTRTSYPTEWYVDE